MRRATHSGIFSRALRNSPSAPVLVGREGGQRQRMDPRREFLGQGLIDEALSRDPVLADKNGGDDSNREMCLPLRPGTRMSGVAMRFVFDLEPDRSEPGRQLLANGFGNAHDGEEIRVDDSRGRQCDAAAHRKPPRSSTTWWMWSPSEPAAAQSARPRIQAVVMPSAAAGTRFFAMSSNIIVAAGVTWWRRSSS